jgi:dTDP-4-amino-4,6-dideoxygalactose transaminase
MSIASSHRQIPITSPLFGEEEERAVLEVLRSGWVVQGPKVAEFEQLVADYAGAPEAIATSSCTTALHLGLVLLGMGPGDEVILPSFTFIATANVVCYTGATPVFVDIDPATYNLDPDGIEAAITPRTKAIMPVHQIGLSADMDRINTIADRHGLIVIEDAAPALGATYKGKRVGGLGNVTCLSFHPRKVITSGEGGMILTHDQALARSARSLRTHGMSLSDLQRHHATSVAIEEYHDLGYNYRLSDLHAAVGIEQMKKLDFILRRRKEIAARYNEGLADLDCIQLPFSSPDQPHSYQSYIIQLRPQTPKTRERVMQEMLEAGISTRRGVMAIHMEPYYRQRFPRVTLSVTETAAKSTLLLPIYTTITDLDQEYVIDHLHRILHTWSMRA